VIFFVAKNHHFAKKEVPSNMVNGTFWKIFQKNCQDFWRIGQISSFLLLKFSYLTNNF
jgi:hypothetical protein